MASPATPAPAARPAQRDAPAGTGLLARAAMLSETRWWAWLLILPSLLLVAAVVIYPVGSGILLSFREMRLTRPSPGFNFVGLEHYATLLRDPVFRIAATNTAVWVIAGALSQFALGLVAALALNRPLPLIWLARILVLLPWLMPSVVAGHMWALMLDSRLGVVNDLLLRMGIVDAYRAWFADPATAMPAVLLVELWRNFPFFALFLLAGMQAIPQELYDAAAMDGAGPLRRFFDVTLPLLAPVIVAATVLRTIGLFNSPDLMIVLTNGGPGFATQVLSLYAFQTAYAKFDFGYAAAISVVILLALMAFTLVYVRVAGAKGE